MMITPVYSLTADVLVYLWSDEWDPTSHHAKQGFLCSQIAGAPCTAAQVFQKKKNYRLSSYRNGMMQYCNQRASGRNGKRNSSTAQAKEEKQEEPSR